MGNLLAAISVLLVFLTFLFQSIDKEVSGKIDKPIPDVNKTNERARFKSELRKLFFLKSLPISIIYLTTTYSLLPKTVYILHHSKIDLWSFNPLNTIFVFIEYGLVGLTLYAILKTIQLYKKINSFTP